LSQSIGTYLSVKPETGVKSTARQARATAPDESQPSRWRSRFLVIPVATPIQTLVDAKETLVGVIRQTQVDEETFNSLVEEQKVKGTENTTKDLMSIYGEAMTGGPGEASRGEGGAQA
jgi:hypothetical protein